MRKNSVLYHGHNRRNFFEGWYYKIEDRNGEHVFALIPGIVKGSSRNSHSFIQFLQKNSTAYYFPYASSAFTASDNPFAVSIDKNIFTLNHIHLSIEKDIRLTGHIDIDNMHRWPRSVFAPGVMGPFSYIPFMQCNHGIVSMHHEINGYLELNGKRIDMNGGRGYIEKDWGSAFPLSWIWMQCNRFDNENMSLFMSIAHIPVGEFSFEGLIAGLMYNNKIIPFATYYGSHYSLKTVKSDFAHIILKNRQYEMDIKMHEGIGADLPAPKPGQMTSKVNESINGIVELSLKKGNILQLTAKGYNAGVEIHMPQVKQ